MLLINPFKQSFRNPSTRSIFNLRKKKDFGICNPVTVGCVSPERPVPESVRKPPYYFKYMPPGNTIGEVEIKSSEQIYRLRASCKLAAKILHSCEDIVKVGNTTDDIDAFVHEKIIAANAYPSPLRYAGFPKSICTSVNNVACHGIPDNRPLMDGDIVNVDITTYYNGYHGDCSKTFMVGDVDERGRYLVESTQECLMESIKLCSPGKPFNTIGKFISTFVKKKNLGLIPAFIGHGIGSYFHGPPEILHYKNSMPGIMEPGMTFTIEPILTLGGPDIEIQEDGWTALSVDGARSAQFEHTVLITQKGYEVLTALD
ncbi:methionine aminopeptidase 1D, mitochondrial [Episyrphus balteatus]|uniref:methionine aminopeptidase 1D, mitochondrial n=1 Tax=Episyrphus balteatus TaxID=286459 RepID=UPI0024856909|nr:methionine aminopeptidase 1D, mitochondrial [Episyrphus balteatus]